MKYMYRCAECGYEAELEEEFGMSVFSQIKCEVCGNRLTKLPW